MAVAIPMVMLAMAAAGTAVTVAGAISQGQAASSAAKFNQQVANNNAKAATDQAAYAANQKDLQLKQIIGAQTAAGAAGGTTGGSLTDVQYSSEVQGKLDQLGTKYQGQIAANNATAQGQLAGISGQNALTNSYFQAGGSAMSGAAGAMNMYENNQGYGAQTGSYDEGFPELSGYTN